MEKMLQSMMERFRIFIAMGFMIVVISLIIGSWNAGNATTYYAVDKATRDTSQQWANVRATIESTIIWLPYFKFLGVSMILSGITMALGVIGLRLMKLGKEVMGSVPRQARINVPPKPKSALLMRLFMMMGMMIILIGFIVSLVTAGTASAVFSHPITDIDAAATGSALLKDLASVLATEAWLEAFKFVGVGFHFLGIIYGLVSILFALSYQQKAIPEVVKKLPPVGRPSLGTAD
ncbi:MAG: hypothetical protein GY796_23355 [Chloroflexi bacterium]|nr:hypothetical protein [Chloroflexota bacterium]